MTENENITEEYTEEEAVKPRSSKKDKIFSLAAKIMAVVVAFFIWIYAVGTDSTLQEKNVTGNVIDVVGVASGRRYHQGTLCRRRKCRYGRYRCVC